jgi:zinc/manganese transport system substrate-binding protein
MSYCLADVIRTPADPLDGVKGNVMKVWRFSGAVAMALSGVLMLAGCAGGSTSASSQASASSAGMIKVVASTNVWGDIASRIGGDQVEVTSIIDDPNKDPHEYQASSRNQLALSQAQLVVENGGGYDDFVDTMLQSAGNPKVVVLNAVQLSGDKPAPGQDLNEHVWYDYAAVRKVAEAVRDQLTTIDPGGSTVFAANTQAFTAGLDKLNASVADLKAKYAGKGVAITEPVLLYLLDALGMVNKTPEEFSKAIEDGTDPTPSVLNQTLALFTNHEVSVLAYNEQTSGPITQEVFDAANAAKVPAVPVQETVPSGMIYLDWQAGIITALGRAIAQ